MIRIPLHEGWTAGPKLGAFEAATDATAPRPVRLPHDALRDLPRSADSDQGVHAGYHPGGVFEYAHTLEVPRRWRDKTVLLEFEGVYRDATVRVNGDFAAHESGGYNAFTVALDPFSASASPTASRWRPGRTRTVAGTPARASTVPSTSSSPRRCTSPSTDCGSPRPTSTPNARSSWFSADVVNDTRHTRRTRVAWTLTAPDGREVAVDSAPHRSAGPEDDGARPPRRRPARTLASRPPCAATARASPARRDRRPIDEDAAVLRHPASSLDPQHGLRIDGEGREAPGRVRAPRQRTARRGDVRRGGGPARATAEGRGLQTRCAAPTTR